MRRDDSANAPAQHTPQLSSASYDVEGGAVLILRGSLTRFTSGLAFDALSCLMRCGHETIWLDAKNLTYVTRAGTRSLIVAAKIQQSAGRRLFITRASAEVRESLNDTGFTHLFEIVNNASEVRKSVTSS